MSGRDKAAEQQKRDLTNQQMALYQQQVGAYNDRLAKADTMQKPAIDYATKVATDPLGTMRAAQGGLFDVDQAVKAGSQSVMDSVPEGAARDYALAKIKATAPVQRQQALHDSFLQALGILGGFGQQTTETAMQQLGAGMRSGEAASSAASDLMTAAQQRQAALFGMIGQAAGMAGYMSGKPWKR